MPRTSPPCRKRWPRRPCYNARRRIIPTESAPMTDNTQTPATLVEALERFEDSKQGRETVLQLLLRSRVFVLLDKPWDGRSLPNSETRLLYVSDGEDKE